MASVTKLVLVPAEDWMRITRGRKDIDKQSLKTVEISRSGARANQAGEGPKELLGEESSYASGPSGPVGVRGARSPPPSLPSPPPSPGEKRGREREGAGKDGEERKYVEREHSGKEKSPARVKREAGIWRPPGKPRKNQSGKGGKEKKPSGIIKWIYL